jgi:hypothetical protein
MKEEEENKVDKRYNNMIWERALHKPVHCTVSVQMAPSELLSYSSLQSVSMHRVQFTCQWTDSKQRRSSSLWIRSVERFIFATSFALSYGSGSAESSGRRSFTSLELSLSFRTNGDFASTYEFLHSSPTRRPFTYVLCSRHDYCS